jgi:hypothetical protein
MPICARIFMPVLLALALLPALAPIGRVQPIDLGHLAHHDELVAVGADGAVVVEAVAELGVTANHVRRLENDARHRVVNAAAHAGDFRSRGVDDLFLGVVHQHHARVDPLTHHRSRGDGAIDIEEFDPVVIDDAGGSWRRLRSTR